MLQVYREFGVNIDVTGWATHPSPPIVPLSLLLLSMVGSLSHFFPFRQQAFLYSSCCLLTILLVSWQPASLARSNVSLGKWPLDDFYEPAPFPFRFYQGAVLLAA